MRFVFGFLIVAAIAAGILKHTRQDNSAPPATTAAQTAKALPATTVQTPSAHNWPKSSLDRVAEVKRQVAQQRKEDGY
jgi:hypothetical protein